MKILILANSDSGLYQFRKELIEQLSKKNKVVCSVPDTDGFIGKLKKLGCKCVITGIDRRGVNPIKDLRLFFTYLKLIRRFHPDVVLTYTIKPNVYGGIASRMTHTSYLANITGLGTAIENGGLLSKLSLFLYRIGLKKSSCIFFQNRSNLEFFEKKGIVRDNECLLPGSGVNIETHYLEDYPRDEFPFRFLFVGRVMKDKGIEELLGAVRILSERELNIVLDVVGACDEDYQDILKEYEADGLIKYHGKKDDVHPFYANAHCVVLPSYHEGMANVLLEAASTGRPVIATRIPGCMETFDEGVSGLGCDVYDTMSLVSAMTKMYSLPMEERRKMGLAGRKKVSEKFDRSIVVKSYLEQIKKIAKK